MIELSDGRLFGDPRFGVLTSFFRNNTAEHGILFNTGPKWVAVFGVYWITTSKAKVLRIREADQSPLGATVWEYAFTRAQPGASLEQNMAIHYLDTPLFLKPNTQYRYTFINIANSTQPQGHHCYNLQLQGGASLDYRNLFGFTGQYAVLTEASGNTVWRDGLSSGGESFTILPEMGLISFDLPFMQTTFIGTQVS